jgi:hypothetical protein
MGNADRTMSQVAKQQLPFARGWIPIWLHVAISMGMAIAGFVGGLLFAEVVIHRLALSGESLPGFGIYTALSIVSMIVPVALMHKFVPARCSQCGGRCWAPKPRGSKTVKYICENCGCTVDTQMRGGDV